MYRLLLFISLQVLQVAFSQHIISMERERGGLITHQHHVNHISNKTIAGSGGVISLPSGSVYMECKHSTVYVTTPIVKFPMCTGQSHQDLKNGMSIINLVASRGFLPTCRIMQLMLWMAASVSDRGTLARETFVDIGSNIGSCTVHMASLGFPVIAVEPVQQHIDTIRGSMALNPSFHIDLHHIGLSYIDRSIHATFGHGARNWGASAINEVSAAKNESFETVLKLKTLDQVVMSRKLSLLKIDCEGCEWEAIKGGRRTLKKVPMIKLELVQPEYTAGNETIKAEDIILFLNRSNFDIYLDHWNEQSLYFGNYGNQLMDIDKMFGSEKFKNQITAADSELMREKAAIMILSNPVDPATFNQRQFLKKHTDIIAIERSLSKKMKNRFLSLT